MKNLLILWVLCIGVTSTSCQRKGIKDNTGLIVPTGERIQVSTDKARYLPGERVVFSVDGDLPAGTSVSYKFLGDEIGRQTLSGNSWNWTPPPTDFSGYMAELSRHENGKDTIYGCIGVDVSSDPARFPRNGFLSQYGSLGQSEIDQVMTYLNRLHMNWIQFQDWEYKHHEPLAGTPAHPDDSWKDIASRTNYKSTVQAYIQSAQSFQMKTLSYNMIYGALDDAAADGVAPEWYMYTDGQHQSKQVISLPKPPFKSDIFFLDPSNPGWQDYIAAKTNEAFEVYDFDGYQVDQFGNLNKDLYTWSGEKIDLESAFGNFLNAMKLKMPGKTLVMNAVNQYGQEKSISKSPVDFLYTEVWAPHEGYKDLSDILQNNDRWSNGKKSVLCAYMDYNLAENPGNFNTPGVLLTDAVIFAFGGAHLELGEHMLGKEYFPNDNLQMKEELRSAMIRYYDFLTAYENVLRDGGTFNSPVVTSGDMPLNNWPPVSGAVSVVGKEMGSRQVLHFINFSTAGALDWRDADGKREEPTFFRDPEVTLQSAKKVKNIWFASPDLRYGASQSLEFSQSGNSVTFSLPSLSYWDMVVVEYE